MSEGQRINLMAFVATATIFAVLTLLMLVASMVSVSARTNDLVGGDKVCKCVSHGPKGGCLRWSCRRQYHRPQPGSKEY